MSGTAAEQGALQIIESILSEADTQAKKLRENAERAAQAELDEARRQAQAARQGILDKAELAAQKTRAREAATARTEARRILLAAREELVARALHKISEELKALRNDPTSCRTSLANLAREAAIAVDEAAVVLRIAPSDAAIADAAFLEELSGSIRAASGRAPQLSIEVAPRDLGGGCEAASMNGRVVFDNTFRRRLERGMRELRAAVIAQTGQSHG